ncbi:MAG: class I adenylate-forming enzyme family protein [Dermatophilaceae bacterium]
MSAADGVSAGAASTSAAADIVLSVDVIAPDLPVVDDYVVHHAARTPDALAVVDGEIRLTYRQLLERMGAVSAAMLASGVGHGDRVALLAHPGAAFVETLLATISIGAVFQGLNPKHQPAELARDLADTRPGLVLTTGEGELPTDVASVQLGTPEAQRWLERGAGLPAAQLVAARDRVEPGDSAVLVHTSGSTGRPRGALLPHRGLIACGRIQGTHVQVAGQPPVVINNLPVDHVGSVGDITIAALIAGGTVVTQSRFEPGLVLDALARERVTVWGGVPAMFARCVEHPAFPDADLSSVSVIATGGGPLPLPLARRLARRVQRIVTMYGMTETIGHVTFSAPADPLETVAATIGRPDPRHLVTVVRADGTPCDVGEVGEIRVGAPALMNGYWERPDDTAAAFDDEDRLRTGDLARRRTDGCLQLVGRLQERYKSGGYTVDPREVELALEAHPEVRLAVVVARPHPVYGETGTAFVLADPDRITPTALDAHLRDRLANYKIPKTIHVRPELPVLPVGKVDRARLRQEARA